MVYTDPPQSSLFRIEINVNFLWEWLRVNNYTEFHNFDILKIAGRVEDELNMTNLLFKCRLDVHDVIRKHVSHAYKKDAA